MGPNRWGLEVVRGREVGRVYPVGPGSTWLGNALNGSPGIDLTAEEGNSPRKMAPRQARIDDAANGLTLHDLDSPGGTFVNRQRLLGGQGRPLRAGDVIQVGGVQLKVVTIDPKPTGNQSAAAPGPVTRGAPFRMSDGSVCQTWDDFLAASSRSWTALRQELASGRLGDYLTAQGRNDLLPRPARPGSTEDDRLDEWLARLPTTRPAVAEMDVHPAQLRARATLGGGSTRLSLRVTNTGYRLLRTSLRVEHEGAGWIKIVPPFASGSFNTPEESVIPIEVTIPENLPAPIVTALWVEGNAGSRRVEIRLEPARGADPIPPPSSWRRVPGRSAWNALRALPTHQRIARLAIGMLVLRAIVAVGDVLSGKLPIGETETPALGGSAILLGGLGAFVAACLAGRHGEARDVPPSAFAGGVGGIVLAALLVSSCRAVEPLLGTIAMGMLPSLLLWTGLGAALGWALGSFGQPPHDVNPRPETRP